MTFFSAIFDFLFGYDRRFSGFFEAFLRLILPFFRLALTFTRLFFRSVKYKTHNCPGLARKNS